MGGQMQGDEMKGRKTAVVFTAMDGSEGWKNKSIQKKKGPMGVVEGCPGYRCRTAAMMAIVASAFNRAHPNYVLPIRPFKLQLRFSSRCRFRFARPVIKAENPFLDMKE
jgi:hypothetical protein